MIAIGAVYLGPELEDSMLQHRIRCLTRIAERLRTSYGFGTVPSINVVYFIPGSFEKVKFERMRDAKFSRKRQLLMVQVAVAEREWTQPLFDGFLIWSLHDANKLAFEFFRKKGIVYAIAEAEKMVEQLHKELEKEK